MKTLIVDDQIVSRMKIQKIMEGICEIDAVDCGQAAIDAYKKSLEIKTPYDLITLDVSMPDLDGREVLKTIRDLEDDHEIDKDRQVKILMITSSSDKETVLSSIHAGCDDYLVKPLNREAISNKLKKFGLIVSNESNGQESKGQRTISQMIDTTIDRFKKGELDLPTMPHIVTEIQNVIDNSSSSVLAVTAIIEKDVSIAVKLIATANSPLYRGVDKIQNVHAAISRLGLKEIQEIVNTIANKNLYNTKNKQLKKLLDKLWLHSLACANAAKLISDRVPQTSSEDAFMGGLIHDIGSVLLLKCLGDVVNSDFKINEEELINSVFEVHTDFGAALLNKWEFTKSFVEICKLHEWADFAPDTDREVLIVNLADQLTEKIEYGFFLKESVELFELNSAKMMEIDAAAIDAVIKEVSSIMADSAKLF
jgi:HD-like signal output (HDOD) protein/FixJ family two-component response regulator